VDTLAGIPSVVFGLCGLVALVPLIRSVAPPGLSLLAGCLVLGAMIFPLAAAAGDAAIQQADPSEFASARALGLGAWDAARLAILPRALPAFSTGCLLALGRALGETMALLMVAGNTIAWPGSLATPFRTLTMHVASEMAYASGTHRSALFVAAGLLLTLVGAIGLVGTLGGARDRGA
jgi:phosphate transport system permease protein